MTSRTGYALPASIAFAWALAGLLHLLSFRWTLPLSWDGALYTGATFLLLARPSCQWRQLAFLFSTAVILANNYEDASNHLVLEFWITVSALIAFLLRRLGSNRSSLFETIAPLVRAQYLIVFCFAAFSKFNQDFLDPEWSCASVFAVQTIEFLHLETLSFGLLSAESALVLQAAIYLTIACEIAIPSLLFFRRTRIAGIYLALGFHFALGFIPILGISSFSALSFVLLLFFIPPRTLELLEQYRRELVRPLTRNSLTRLVSTLLALLAASAAISVQYRYYHPAAAPVAFTVWLMLYLPFLWLTIKALRNTSRDEFATIQRNDLITRPAYLATLNLPVVLLGVLPYFGLQTQGSFTMFSNLRVLGDRPNHLIANPTAPQSSQVLIKILATNHPELASYPDSGLLVTSHEFRRKTASTEQDFYALCEWDNSIELIGRFEGDLTPHPFFDPLPAFPNRWIRFRDVSASDHCECSW